MIEEKIDYAHSPELEVDGVAMIHCGSVEIISEPRHLSITIDGHPIDRIRRFSIEQDFGGGAIPILKVELYPN
jgi:hypothetical protein